MNQADNPVKASIKNILYLCLISTALSLALPAKAQITPDNTLGAEASQLNQNLIINGAPGDKINGGATRGSNLFHSFSEFNIQDGQRVYFANPSSIENILTRVTGGNASNIFGTLGVDGAARAKGVGNGGNITIDSGSFLLRDRAALLASTQGEGNAGNVTVSAKNAVFLANAGILSTVETGGIGKGGNIEINAVTLSLTDRAALTASTQGEGNAGNVTVNAKNAVFLANAGILSAVGAGGVGKGGNININAATLSLTNGAGLAASTLGLGNAGNVTVNAKNAIFLANAGILSTVEAGGVNKYQYTR